MLVTNHIPLFAVINNLSSAFTRDKLALINQFLSFVFNIVTDIESDKQWIFEF